MQYRGAAQLWRLRNILIWEARLHNSRLKMNNIFIHKMYLYTSHFKDLYKQYTAPITGLLS